MSNRNPRNSINANFYAALIKLIRTEKRSNLLQAMRDTLKNNKNLRLPEEKKRPTPGKRTYNGIVDKNDILRYAPVLPVAATEYIADYAPDILEILKTPEHGVTHAWRISGNSFNILVRAGIVRISSPEASEILAALDFNSSSSYCRPGRNLKARSISKYIGESGVTEEFTLKEQLSIGKKRFQKTDYYENSGRAELIEELLQRAAEPNPLLDEINEYHEVEITFDDIATALQLTAEEREHFGRYYAELIEAGMDI